MDRLRDGSDQESTLLLAALRLGVKFDRVLEALRAEDPFASLQQATREMSPIEPVPKGDTSTPIIASLENEAWEHAEIKLYAQPWTDVAGDGLVSELISSFFHWDNAFCFPFIDKSSFLQGLNKADTNDLDSCSPCLVNAICAIRCVRLPARGNTGRY